MIDIIKVIIFALFALPMTYLISGMADGTDVPALPRKHKWKRINRSHRKCEICNVSIYLKNCNPCSQTIIHGLYEWEYEAPYKNMECDKIIMHKALK